jgi:hypothetical protein
MESKLKNPDQNPEEVKNVTLVLPAQSVAFIVNVLGNAPLPFNQTAPLLESIRRQYVASISSDKKDETEKEAS